MLPGTPFACVVDVVAQIRMAERQMREERERSQQLNDTMTQAAAEAAGQAVALCTVDEAGAGSCEEGAPANYVFKVNRFDPTTGRELGSGAEDGAGGGVGDSGGDDRGGGGSTGSLSLSSWVTSSVASWFGAGGMDGPPVASDALGRDLSQAFYVWLGLSPDSFWVNLKPNEPERVIDAEIGATVVGQVLLEADFVLKNETSWAMHPASPSGKYFWEAIFEPPPASTCVSFRQWITPGTARVVESGSSLYVVEAGLSVKEEAQYFQDTSTGNIVHRPASTCDNANADPRILKTAEDTFRSTVLPEVFERVARSTVFQNLRTIYYWRVVAEWYRKHRPGFFKGVEPKHYRAHSVEAGRKYAGRVFQAYYKSAVDGSFVAEQKVHHAGRAFLRTYTHGSIDFSRVDLTTNTLGGKGGEARGAREAREEGGGEGSGEGGAETDV
jgi:hypothetical protein